jgi:F-type H+-transporting ATPase subunit epsilon
VAGGAAPAGARRTLRLRVLSPARTVFDGEAAAVTLPAFDGEWGILPNHAPMVAELAVGCLRVTKPDGGGEAFAVRGGFAQVRDNVVTVLTSECAGPGELVPADVDAELARLHGGGDVDKSTGACQQRAARLAWAKACRLALNTAAPSKKS